MQVRILKQKQKTSQHPNEGILTAANTESLASSISSSVNDPFLAQVTESSNAFKVLDVLGSLYENYKLVHTYSSTQSDSYGFEHGKHRH